MSTRFCPDTNVLLRLQDVGALTAITTLTDCEFVLTDIVWSEATRKPGVGTAAKKILTGIDYVVTHDFMPNAPDTLMFDKLRKHYPESNYQDGELSVIALAALNTDLIPIVFDRRGHIAACDELRRLVLTAHWFFSKLHTHHNLPTKVLDDLVALLHAKSYLTPTWHTPTPTAVSSSSPGAASPAAASSSTPGASPSAGVSSDTDLT
jgi:hypothetical protein